MPFQACEERDARLSRRQSLWRRPVRSSRHHRRRSAQDVMTTTSGRALPLLLKTANFSGGNQQKVVLAREDRAQSASSCSSASRLRGVLDIGAIEFDSQTSCRAAPTLPARRGIAARLGGARRDHGAVRPHPRRLRRRITGERRPRRHQPAGSRPADGRRRRVHCGIGAPVELPKWADVALIPLINVTAAFVISGLVVTAIGENPFEAVKLLIGGALGDLEGVGFTLYYATSFIFTGLAVAICFQGGLFNIGVDWAGLCGRPRGNARLPLSRLPRRATL